jgi:CDP-6-deoxy-D-xylo-4-hexulose-3-dehydrase
LEKNGVETRPLFSCIPTQQPSFEYLKDEYLGKLPNAEYLGKNGFYIGCHQFLNEEDLEYIIESFKKNLA